MEVIEVLMLSTLITWLEFPCLDDQWRLWAISWPGKVAFKVTSLHSNGVFVLYTVSAAGLCDVYVAHGSRL